MSNANVRSRLRDWQRRLGLSRDAQPQRGPSNEDIAREQSYLQKIANDPNPNPAAVAANEQLKASRHAATPSQEQS
jgi:hypothetical protein